ncbi:MAG: DUF5786 family protein [Haloferacaceae archaeon]
MSMGAYDEDEHERREQKASQVDADFEGARSDFRGELEYDDGDSAEALIEQFEQLKGD